MLRTAFRNVIAHKLRLLTTGLAVTLGVAFLTGTLVLGDTLTKTFDDLFADVYKNTDAVVRAEGVFEDPDGFGEQRGRIDKSMVEVVAGVDGVRIAEPTIWGFALLADKEGEPVADPMNGPPSFGTNWTDTPELNSFNLAEGRGPRADDEIVIDKQSADDAGYHAGDMATVLVKGGPQQMRVVGIVRFGSADSPGGAAFVLFTTPAAERLIGEVGRIDTVSVVADEGISQQEIVRRITRAVPDGHEVITGKAVTEESQDGFREMLSIFKTIMLFFAIVALVVAFFMIFNTFFITVAQRTRENALMRAVGASRRQVLAAVLLEALAVGVLASAVGLLAGLGLAFGLKALLNAFGMSLPEGGLVFTANTALRAFMVGVFVTMLAAISPARKAGKVPPVEAMRDVAVGSTGYGSKERIMVGLALLAGAVGMLVYGLTGDPGNALSVVGIGMLLVFASVLVLGRTIALPLSRLIGAPLPRMRGISGQLARENAMRNPKRTAATASALMIGVGVVGFITIFAASTKASFSAAVDKTFTGDLIVTSTAGMGFGGVDPALTERLNTVPEVDVATGIRVGVADVDGDVDQIVAVDPVRAFDIIDVDPKAGSPADLGVDAIAVLDKTATKKGLRIGDPVPVRFRDTGLQELRVALIYGESHAAGQEEADYLLGMPAYEANFADQYDFQIFIEVASGTTPAAAVPAIERVTSEFPGTKVLDLTEFKDEQLAAVDQMLGLFYALLGLAVVIALLGIGNTLALSIIERTRELGVLRAVGMTRNQLRSTIRWESVIIALQGTFLGLVVGLLCGWILVQALDEEGIDIFSVPVTTLGVMVVLAALAGVLAAVAPARRAAKLNVLRAIVSE